MQRPTWLTSTDALRAEVLNSAPRDAVMAEVKAAHSAIQEKRGVNTAGAVLACVACAICAPASIWLPVVVATGSAAVIIGARLLHGNVKPLAENRLVLRRVVQAQRLRARHAGSKALHPTI